MKPYYERGGITIYHGDCLRVMRELPDKSVDAVITDPPYGIAFVSSWTKRKERILNDGLDDWLSLMRLWLPEAKRVMNDYSVMCCCCGGGGGGTPSTAMLTMEAVQHLNLIQTLVWKKTIGLGWRWRPSYENILVLARDKDNYAFYDESKRCSNVIEGINQDIPSADEHPTQKPPELMMKLIQIHSQPGNMILDPFMGSGTTLVAAKRLGRKAIGIEISEKYCEIAVNRLAQEVMSLV